MWPLEKLDPPKNTMYQLSELDRPLPECVQATLYMYDVNFDGGKKFAHAISSPYWGGGDFGHGTYSRNQQ